MPNGYAPNADASERLELAMAHAGLNGNGLASRLGITAASLSQLKAGRIKSPERWAQIARILSVDARWLTAGEGAPPGYLCPEISLYGIRISSRDGESGLEAAIEWASHLHREGAAALVERLFFDSKLGVVHLEARGGADTERVHAALAKMRGQVRTLCFEADYYPGQEADASTQRETATPTDPWRLLAEIQTARVLERDAQAQRTAEVHAVQVELTECRAQLQARAARDAAVEARLACLEHAVRSLREELETCRTGTACQLHAPGALRAAEGKTPPPQLAQTAC